ncbi:hypothetical protein QT397_18215 [Microbulbifer sp. MKSA007]|nr:hypothetical protein QT397_18215 [Microbulbifer sp. MKSA007]
MSEAAECHEELSSSKLDYIRSYGQAGFDNFNIIDLFSSILPFESVSLPPLYLKNGEVMRVFGGEKII